MQTKFIAVIVIAVLVVVFSMQNLETATVDLWFWEMESAIAMVIIFSFGLGALASAAFSIPSIIAKNNRIRKLEKELKNQGASNTNDTPPEELDTWENAAES